MNQEKEEKGSYICEYKKQVLYLLSKLTAMLWKAIYVTWNFLHVNGSYLF